MSALVKARQIKFFKKMIAARSEMNDDPFMHAYGITQDMNKPMWQYIDRVMNTDDFVTDEIMRIKEKIENQPPTAAKFQTY